nr:immunoglobulin heavy chain junction region [Macaca mulatta]
CARGHLVQLMLFYFDHW